MQGLEEESDRRRLEAVYRNAIFTARRWQVACAPDAEIGANTLGTYAGLLAYSTPAGIGRGTVGPALTKDQEQSR